MNGCEGRQKEERHVGVCHTRTLPPVSAPESAMSELRSAVAALAADPPESSSGIIRLEVRVRYQTGRAADWVVEIWCYPPPVSCRLFSVPITRWPLFPPRRRRSSTVHPVSLRGSDRRSGRRLRRCSAGAAAGIVFPRRRPRRPRRRRAT